MNGKARRSAISFLLTFLLVFELIPAWVFADDSESSGNEETYTEEQEYSDPEGELTDDSLTGEQIAEDETSDPDNGEPVFDDDIIVDEYANNIASSEKAEIAEEVPIRRDEFMKEFMLENGMHLATIYPMSVHYDDDGKWGEIDNTLVLEEEEGKSSYHNTAGLWDVSLPTEFGSDSEIVLDHDGYKLSFRFAGEVAEKRDQGQGEGEGDTVFLDEDDNTEADFSEEDEAEEEGQLGSIGEPAETPEEEYTEDGEGDGTEEPDSNESSGGDDTEAGAASDEENIEEDEPEDQVRNVYIGTEEYELRPVSKAEGIVSDEKENRYSRTGSLAEEILSTIYSSISYYEVFEKTDLKYDLISNQLKENILIREYRDDLVGYRYELICDDLRLEKTEDGEITAYPSDEAGEPLFYLPAPFLYDNSHVKTDSIEILLEETEEGYLLTYLLPREWLSDERCEYPVTLDPVIQPVSSLYTIQDQTVASGHTYSYTWGYVEAGRYSSSYGTERIFMKFQNIPTLTSSDVIVSASVSMYQVNTSSSIAIEAHKVNGDWDSSTLNWSNMPGTNGLVEDFVLCQSTGWKTWDITNIAKEWYDSNQNYGVMFKATNAFENGSTNNYARFYSSDCGVTNGTPILQIAYIDNTGLEGIWDYTSQSMGRAGTGHVNLYTGNLVWEHESMGFSGNRMPVTIKFYYNANDKGNNTFGAGYGWRTNFNQLVYQWSQDSTYYVWEDGDGTRHYFKYKSSGLYENELDSKMTLTTTGGGGTVYCISEEGSAIKSYFDSSGRLTQITNYQQTAHSITVTYSGTTKLILTVTDGAGRKYAYSYNGQSIQGIYYYGTQSTTVERIYYTQTNNELTGVTYQDSKTTSFSYTSNHLLNGAYDVNGAKVLYTYNQLGSTVPNRVIYISEYGVGNALSGSLEFTYTQGETKLKDNLNNIRILQFNNWGSTTCVQNDLGQAVASRYVNSSSGSTDNRKTGSQVALNSKLQNTVTNLVLNGGFEKGTDYWSLAAGSCTNGSRASETNVNYVYLGSRAYKMTQYKDGSNSPGDYRVQTGSTAWHYAQPGEVYTVSAYVKVKSIEWSVVEKY